VSTTSPKLGLTVPATTDLFSTSTLASNWGTIDSSPGIWSGAYSAILAKTAGWGSPSAHTGMTFWDTTSNVMWVWNGTQLIRPYAKGLLPVQATGTTPGTALATTPGTAVSSTAYTITTTNAGIWNPQFVIPPMAHSVRFDVYVHGITQSSGYLAIGAPVYFTPCTTYPATLNTTGAKFANAGAQIYSQSDGVLFSSWAVNISNTTLNQSGGIAVVLLNGNTSTGSATLASGAITVVATEV